MWSLGRRRQASQSTKIYQIFYDSNTRAGLDPGFLPLDNQDNLRPDWYEVWPILRYLEENEIEDECWYGFLSPRFRQKTHLTSGRVHGWISTCGEDADVVVFSQRLKNRFRNVFDQGEQTHPGLMDVAQESFAALGIDLDLRQLRMEKDAAVFSNYFVAKGVFWRQWGSVVRGVFNLAELEGTSLGAKLRAETTYRADVPPVPMKVFVVERVASLLLSLNPAMRVVAHRPMILRKLLPRSIRRLFEMPRDSKAKD